MSTPLAPRHSPVIIGPNDIEELPTIGHHLLVDSPATGGALSCHRVQLVAGQDGATPHLHRGSSEMFVVLDGALDVLVDATVVTARSGALVVVPAGCAHAFAAPPDSAADVLVVITPGVERFDYLREVERIRAGQAPGDGLVPYQDLYDTHFLDRDGWAQRRGSPG